MTMLCSRCWGAKTLPRIPGVRAPQRCDLCQGAGVAPDVQLSPHFRLSEMVASSTAVRLGIANDPTPQQVDNLRALCVEVLEPVRAAKGPIVVTSGYRSPALNKAKGGAAKSAHVEGHAADVKPAAAGVKVRDLVDAVPALRVSFDQAIFETTWCHVGRIGPGGAVRSQVLQMFPGPGGRPVYSPFDPRDPRVCA